MATIPENIQQLRARMALACEQASRPVHSVTLLVVTKTFPAEDVRAAFLAGETRFGENYVQEGLDKIAALDDMRSQIEWHMIGPLQSNKTRPVAEQFDWVHSVDRLKIAQRLSDQRPAHLPPLQLCLQVNISGEATKSGLTPDEVPDVARAVAALPRVRLRGLMAIPEPGDSLDSQRQPHHALAQLLQQLQAQGLAVDTLSMGMSGDLEAAILEGSTMVRVGSAIFGQRQRHASPTTAIGQSDDTSTA